MFRKNCYKENFPIRHVSANNLQTTMKSELDNHLVHHQQYLIKDDMMEQTFGKSPYKNLRDKSRSQSRGAMHDLHRNPYI